MVTMPMVILGLGSQGNFMENDVKVTVLGVLEEGSEY